MRNTKQKQLVYEIVNSSYNHLTANEIYDQARQTIANISLGTVYRILNDLADNRKILRITTKSGIDHFDRLDEENHQHFICNDCGKIVDVFHTDFSYRDEELKDYQIDNVKITFTGLCDDCLKGRK